ncbi:MAG: TPR domain protein [candidate division TM6 bacterium GW2011_GWF2_38_10]|nr:MAG: TPR domain protein [candidate division TM6 bacterium GW2011_GWF2_38_10]
MINAPHKKNVSSYLSWILPPGLLTLFTLIIYWTTLRYEFVFDDFPTIIEYIHARKLDIQGLFFKVSRWVSRILNQYTYINWKDDPFGYRIFDIILHACIGIMVFFVVYKMLSHLKESSFLQTKAYSIALITMGLFLLHPAQTQTVTYITQMRLEGLVVFFTFAVLLCFIYAAYSTLPYTKYTLYALSLLFGAFATGTKEIIVVLPILVMLTDWFFIAQGNWNSFKQRILFHILLTGTVFGFLYLYGVAKAQAIVNAATTPVHNNRGNVITPTQSQYITLWPFFISQFKVILHYLGIFFWPVGLCFDYGYKLAHGFFSLDVILPLFTLLTIFGITAYLFFKDQKNPIVFCWLWFFVSIFPRASLFPGTELICDYKTYIASFGALFFIALCLTALLHTIHQWVKNNRKKTLNTLDYAILGSLFFGILGISTKVRNEVWATEDTFWHDVVEKNPHDARAWNNYAVATNIKGDLQKSISLFEQAISVDDFYAEPHINLATIYHTHGQRNKAFTHYMRALDIGEAHPELFNNLGMFHAEDNHIEQAEFCFKQAVKLRPYFSRPWKNLGDLYRKLNQPEKALNCYEQALSGDTISEELLCAYGMTCNQLGRHEQALQALSNIAQSGNIDAHAHIASALFGLRRYAQACHHFSIVYKHNANNPTLAYNYALALLNNKQPEKALPLFALCLTGANKHPYAPLHYGRCLFEVGKIQEAQQHLKTALSQTQESYIRQDIQTFMQEVKLT